MPTLRERFVQRFMRPELDTLADIQRRLYSAYLEGPYNLPPDELMRQFREYDPQLIADLLDQMNFEVVGGYGGYSDDERSRAVNDSKRMYKYSILARWMVNLWTFYGLGENVSIIAADEAADEVWQDFWEADRNQSVIAKDRLDDISRWLLIKGERFFVFFSSPLDGETTIRNLQPEQVTRVLTNPDDDSENWFYERKWLPSVEGGERTLYYPDWQTFFSDNLKERWTAAMDYYNLDPTAELAGNDATDVCVLFVSFLQLDEEEQRGWPLLAPHGTPWLRAQREFMQDRATVTKGVAAFIRRYKVGGGSRAVDSIRSTIASAFQFGATTETNPPPAAGSSEIMNRGVEAQDLPLRTGASDAKSDGEMFAWMALLSGGLFPHYAGMGDAYRLATATAMERPLEMQFSLYRNQLGSMFRIIVRIVLQFHEASKAITFPTYEAEVSTDRLVEIDLSLISTAVSDIFKNVIVPTLEMGGIPDESQQAIIVFLLQTTLQALGAQDVQDMINEEMFQAMEEPPEEDAEDTELEEQTGKVEPTGQPLSPWTLDRPVPITVDDVARAMRNWERRMPPEAQGALVARSATPEEDATAARTQQQVEDLAL